MVVKYKDWEVGLGGGGGAEVVWMSRAIPSCQGGDEVRI